MRGGRVLTFGDFELDWGAYQLRCSGEVVHLERVPLDLLFLLVDRRGNLVTREEIRQRVWGTDVFIDVDASINGAVRKIRRALRDNADKPNFVAAVPAKGYRFVASVSETNRARPELAATQTSFVGREREMAELQSALADARAGRGSLFLIQGEPGIGKTRLARELGAIALVRGMEILEGHCREHDDAVPYLPFVEILERYVERVSEPKDLRLMLSDGGPELARLLPKLKRLLPDLPPPPKLPAPMGRRQLFNCFCDFVARLAGERATVLLVDDLHWADDSTLSLLLHLACRLSHLPLLLIATYRDADANMSRSFARVLEELVRGRLTQTRRLTGLQCDEIAQMLRHLSGRLPPTALAQDFYRETKGNPFFVEELFRYLESENRLYEASGVFRELRIAEADAPPSLRLVVRPRLARLNDQTQKIIGVAAIIGRSFTMELLAAATAGGPDSNSLWESVEEAEKAGLLLSCADTSKAAFEFSHELVRQIVISGLSAARRLRLHVAVAAAIESLYCDTLEDHLGELAYHYRCGADTTKALDYLERAGRQSIQRSAFKEALESNQSALAMLSLLPKSLDRNLRELRLRHAIVGLLQMTSGLASADTIEAVGRLGALIKGTGDIAQSVDSLITRAMTAYSAADLTSALSLGDEALDLSIETGRHHNIGAIHALEMLSLHFLGDLAGVERHREVVQALFSEPVWGNFPGAQVFVYGISAWTTWMLGRAEIALELMAQCIAAIDGSNLYNMALADMFSAQLYTHLRQWEESEEVARRSVTAAEKNRFPQILAYSRCLTGHAQAQLGLPLEGIQLIRQGITGMLEIGSLLPVGTFMTYLAIAQEQVGAVNDAIQTLEQALETKKDIVVHRPEALRTRGELHSKYRLTEQAEIDFRAAIALARSMGAKVLELRATTNLAMMIGQSGRRAEARLMLAEIYNCFTEGFETADLKEARMLLHDLNQ